MTDAQVTTLVLSLVLPFSMGIAALIYSNSRIGEAKETLRAEIKAETAVLRAEIQAESAALRAEMAELRAHVDTRLSSIEAQLQTQQAHIDAGFERLHEALKIHELEHHK